MPTQTGLTENHQAAPNTQPRTEGKGRRARPAVEDARELHVQCLHRHSHIHRTLNSLNNVDRPPGSARVLLVAASRSDVPTAAAAPDWGIKTPQLAETQRASRPRNTNRTVWVAP